jgi:hypothetical protein
VLTILQKWSTDYRAVLNTLLVLVVILIIAAFVLLNPWLRDWIAANINSTSPRPDWIATGALGALVGIGELIARYKDAPFLALLTPSALLYIAINIAAALGALFLIRAFGWEFGIASQPGQSPANVEVRITQVMVAGLGAMALFRSSLFITRIGNQDVGVGPSAFLSAMLRACDTGVDRTRAVVRANKVKQVMENISYDKEDRSLVEVSTRLMQSSLSDSDKSDLQTAFTTIGSLDMTDRAKALSLGLVVMNQVGPGPFEGAVKALSAEEPHSLLPSFTRSTSNKPTSKEPRSRTPTSKEPPSTKKSTSKKPTPNKPKPPTTSS